MTPLILNLSCRRRGEAIFKTKPLYSWGKGPQIPVKHENWSWLFEEKYLFPLRKFNQDSAAGKKKKEKSTSKRSWPYFGYTGGTKKH